MYPYEGRLKAVRLYLKSGKRIRATIRQPGTQQRILLNPGIENTNSVMIYGLAIFVRG